MDVQYYPNPYSGKTFFGFFSEFVLRLWAFMRGEFSFAHLAPDEIQVLVLTGVAISSALVGCFLVLRKMTMLANSISHTILIGIVIAYLITHQGFVSPLNIEAMLIASVLMGILTAFMTEALTKGARLQEDASTGIIFTSLFAIGIIAVTMLTRNAHVGTEVVMGNVDALQLEDCKLVYTILALNLFLFAIFFKEFKITTFDSGLARTLGIVPVFFNYLLMVQVSLTVVGAFRAVGVLMVLALITGPVLAAKLFSKSLKNMLCIAVALGVLAAFAGVALSRHFLTVYGISLSTAGVVVCTILCIYLTALYIKVLRKFRIQVIFSI